ncbi:MAG: tRNA 2-selenouridine(34) synthase MnmH [Candidatus Riflebacteria bacterium]|nr:tRNA 2-selenouridine(34) synthase MnmH [Candidatus Riflebacteria bacterium]
MEDPTRSIDDLDAVENVVWVDLRTAEEWAQGHIPGAVNLPILDRDMRAEVGRIYHAEGQDRAKLRAVDLAAPGLPGLVRAVADLATRGPVALYCARGGMRSCVLGRLLAGLGIPASVLRGGYKAHRQAVLARLATGIPPLIVLHGYTGAGKTRLLRSVADRFPVLDLERLASHRGSTFGGLGLPEQPTQRQFESLLAARLRSLGPGPVLVEAESPSVGSITLPEKLCEAMRGGRRVFLDVPFELRVKNLVEDYGELALREPGAIEFSLSYLSSRIPGPEVESWRDLVRRGELQRFAEQLLRRHYDPLYERWRRRAGASFWQTIQAPDLATAEIELGRLVESATAGAVP